MSQREASTLVPADRSADPGTPPDSDDSGGSRRRAVLRASLSPRWYGFYVLILFVIVFGALKPDTFLTSANFQAIATNQAVLAILTMAVLLPLVAGEYDLSIASVLTLSMIVCTGLFQSFQLPIVLAVVLAVSAGLLIGIVNGYFVAVAGVSSLVVTLATGSIAIGIAQWWTNGTIFSEHVPTEFQELGQNHVVGLPLPAVYAVAIGLAIWWLLERTPIGRYLYALGDNPEAARLAGLPTRALTLGAFVVAGGVAGFAGVVEAAKLGAGNPTIGPAFLLPVFAAVFLGATIFRLGQYNVVGTLTAVALVSVGLAGIQQLGVPFYIEPVFAGVVLLAAVCLTKRESHGRLRPTASAEAA